MLISAIMPTRGRREYALAALACWTWQTWPWKELVIVDDLDDRSFPAGCDQDGVQYHLMERRLSVGAKRNIACSRARGDVVIHFDDDDWSAPQRLEDQVLRLFSSGAQATGYHSMVFSEHSKVVGKNLSNGERVMYWRYTPPWNDPGSEYALGTSLCYRKEFWRAHPFADVNSGEDNGFVAAARKGKALASVAAGELMIATIHDGNTSVRDLNKMAYQEIA